MWKLSVTSFGARNAPRFQFVTPPYVVAAADPKRNEYFV